MQLQILGTTTNVPYLPHPRDMVTIKEGTPYTVPVDKIFVLRGLGTTTIEDAVATPVFFVANGVTVLRGGTYGPASSTVLAGTRLFTDVCSGGPAPSCMSFPAGTVLSVTSTITGNDGRAWGYTAPAA